ncbi:galactarate dehydratase [Burkholderia thailandensis]|nr:galactarate dehydratase [Burkholderia thailandensis]MCS3390721.1 galactarate dehydratase [Burkholderia thailandensis]MCS6424608.1 galactarate dehydratase [Burkholderia thailandensis]MCS6451835.1 galactarate dehydratase [Burkholderia thailandensis]MCS6463923.1 galactarate dehydratase [Burkholderia thailandensis]MCS6481531.1 galactarate dehydratase [Burkholderia thailandensis]
MERSMREPTSPDGTRTERALTIRVHESDNVAIVVNARGLPAGAILADGTALVEGVPQGHKVALADLAEGDAVVRYGEVIGHAAKPLPRGAWVNEHAVKLPLAPALDELPLATRAAAKRPKLDGYTFDGYRNADGTVGTKNVLGIMTSVQCVAGVTDHVVARIKRELLPRYPNVDDVVALNHTYGCGVAINAPAAIVPIRTLQNLALNPNFGGEVMVIGLGCEKLAPERLVPASLAPGGRIPIGVAGTADSPVLRLQDEAFGGFGAMVDAIMEMADKRLDQLNRRHRESCPASDLVVGVQCGGSDAFSGVTANPAVGFAADLIVRAGGTVMFSEVTEVRDAIHLLTPRAIDAEVGRALLREMAWYDDYLLRGETDRSANPSPGNKTGGLSNVVEKALGSIVKSGTSPIVDVLGPGERMRRKGLIFAATPASDFVCGTLQLASGINLQVFTTGRGTPYGLAMAPVVKVATRKALSERWHDLIDLDAGRIATGEASIADVGWELFHLILDVASGRRQVCADKLGLHNALVLFNPAPVT